MTYEFKMRRSDTQNEWMAGILLSILWEIGQAGGGAHLPANIPESVPEGTRETFRGIWFPR
jgi:hypothetical protein